MKKNWLLSMAACLAITGLVGCGASQGLIRGQSPTVAQTSCKTCETEEFAGETIVGEEFCDECGEEISKAEYLLKGYWLTGLFHHSVDGKPSYAEQASRVSRGQPALPPTYEHNYRVYRPRNLKYPSQNSPGAVVQYPYYTHKGPDDFFLGREELGR